MSAMTKEERSASWKAYRIKNAEKIRSYQREYSIKNAAKKVAAKREWRLKNPEKAAANNQRNNNSPRANATILRRRGLKLLKRLSDSSNDRIKMCKGKVQEAIMRSHAKGRDMGTIAVMLNIPISVIANVIASHKTQ